MESKNRQFNERWEFLFMNFGERLQCLLCLEVVLAMESMSFRSGEVIKQYEVNMAKSFRIDSVVKYFETTSLCHQTDLKIVLELNAHLHTQLCKEMKKCIFFDCIG